MTPDPERIGGDWLAMLRAAETNALAANGQHVKAQGALDFARTYVTQLYDLGVTDVVDLQTGIITRTPKPDAPQADT